MRPRFTDGRANNGVEARVNGSDSSRRYTSSARTMALSPSHVDPCAARPSTTTSRIITPLACTPTCMSVGSPQITKSARSPWSTSISVALGPGWARSSSGTMTSSTCTPGGGVSARLAVAIIMAPRAAFMS